MPYPGYQPRGPRRYDDSGSGHPEQNRKMFIGGLSYETDEKSLRNHFEKYGEITDCIVMKDPQTKRSRGFGFITYKEEDQLDDAQKNRPHTVDGREVETKRAMPRDDPSNQQTVNKMFVGGLKDDTTEDQIRECFQPSCKSIKGVEMIKDKATGKSRGFCFVEFEDTDAVDKFVLKKFFDLNGRRVEVKKAVAKDQQQQFGPPGRGEFGYGPQGYGPSYGMGSGGFGPGPNRASGYGGGYGSQGGYGGGGYGGQNWNQGGGPYDGYGYSQGGNWNNYYGGHGNRGGGYGSGGYGGGSNYNRR